MKKDLFIIGLSANSLVCGEIAEENGYHPIYVLSNVGYESHLSKISKKDVLKFDVFKSKLSKSKKTSCFCGIGNLEKRRSDHLELARLTSARISFINLVHPSAVIHRSARLGTNVQVCAGAVVGVNASIGNFTAINTRASIDHDCVVGDYTHIAPGVVIGGETRIGKQTWIGIGSVVINRIEICANAYIGAGSNVIRSIKKPGVYYGNPAKFRKKL